MTEPAPSTRRRPPKAPKVGFVSLGCPKALVDSERIITQLRAEGYELFKRVAVIHADAIARRVGSRLDVDELEQLTELCRRLRD